VNPPLRSGKRRETDSRDKRGLGDHTDDTVATTTTEYETKDQIVQGANYYLMIADGNVTNCDFAFGFESSIRATRGPSRRWEKRTGLSTET